MMRKKLIQFFVWFFVLTALFAGAISVSAASDSVLGDVNGDGKVSVLDYALLKRHVLGIGELSEEGKATADVNKDGKVNVKELDALYGRMENMLKTAGVF